MKLNVKSLAEVEIGYPVLADGIYHARMEEPKVETNKTGTGNNLIVKFRVLDPILVMHKDGKEVENKGQMVLTRYFSMVPTENYDPDKAVKELAVAIKHPPEQDLEVENLADKVVMIKVEYKVATVLTDAEKAQGKKAYGEGNDIKRVTPVPEDDQFTVPPF